MSSTETFSVDLPAELALFVRASTASGDFSSVSDVIREALFYWQHQSVDLDQSGIDRMRRLWEEARQDDSPGLPAEPVLQNLRQKYVALAEKSRQ